ncbi:MAG: transaminase [Candidatus Nanopelagicales bacterium]
MASPSGASRALRDARVGAALAAEVDRYTAAHPRSLEHFLRARRSQLGGVPMNWMTRWASPFPPVVASANGSRLVDIDGAAYVDFALGDTGAMAGHAPAPTVAAVAEQAALGFTTMLPSRDSVAVSEDLARRFGVPLWQFTLSASDANRFVLRLCRAVTGRTKVLVFDQCYHGSVDETVVRLHEGALAPRIGNLGPQVDPAVTTRVVDFNDVAALERELGRGDVACVLAEPALTNIGIVLPEHGFLDRLREVCDTTGTLLVLDETHTWCAGPGGATAAWGLRPDIVTLGKPVAGGVPIGCYGMTEEFAARVQSVVVPEAADVGGVGGTLAGNALSLAAARATLEQVLTEEAFARMVTLGERFEAGVAEVLAETGLPWHVSRIGARVEYMEGLKAPRTGAQAAAAFDPVVDAYLHLFLLNRGVLMTPFHMMALMSPATTEADVDRHTEVFGQAVQILLPSHDLHDGAGSSDPRDSLP